MSEPSPHNPRHVSTSASSSGGDFAIEADVAIIGSGFSGSLAALALRQRGRRVVLLERGRHPRFAIGESSTPLANLLIEELADRYDLPCIRPFSKWGTWQRARPDVAVGLKRGFTFLFHRLDEAWGDDEGRTRQLLVAASPHDEVADTHWYRPAFDQALVREAEAAGAVHLDETRLDRVRDEGTGMTLEGERHGARVRVTAEFVIDASGPRGFLHRALGLGEAPLRWLPGTQGVYTHFEGVELWERLSQGAGNSRSDGTTDGTTPPYPVDAAALHHVFPGGWIWMLRFNNGLTSAGAALADPLVAQLIGDMPRDGVQAPATDAARLWDRLLDRLPSVRAQFREARPVLPFVHAPRIAFRSARICGDRWAMLPSAAGVIDPLLSTGFPLTLLGLTRLLDLLESTPSGPSRAAALQAYAETTTEELDATERMVAALYATMTEPAVFKRLSLLYFAAASYSEAVRRLGRPALAPGFLLCRHPEFGAELRACTDAAMARRSSNGSRPGPLPERGGAAGDDGARDALLARIDRAIEPFDTAGLLDRTRRDWYPVLASDLLATAAKLHATPAEVQQLLERTGLVPASASTGAR